MLGIVSKHHGVLVEQAYGETRGVAEVAVKVHFVKLLNPGR